MKRTTIAAFGLLLLLSLAMAALAGCETFTREAIEPVVDQGRAELASVRDEIEELKAAIDAEPDADLRVELEQTLKPRLEKLAEYEAKLIAGLERLAGYVELLPTGGEDGDAGTQATIESIGAIGKQVGRDVGGNAGSIIWTVSAILAGLGGVIAQQRRVSTAKSAAREIAAIIQANREANGKSEAHFSDEHKAVMSLAMSKAARELVDEGKAAPPANLKAALEAVHRKAAPAK